MLGDGSLATPITVNNFINRLTAHGEPKYFLKRQELKDIHSQRIFRLSYKVYECRIVIFLIPAMSFVDFY